MGHAIYGPAFDHGAEEDRRRERQFLAKKMLAPSAKGLTTPIDSTSLHLLTNNQNCLFYADTALLTVKRICYTELAAACTVF